MWDLVLRRENYRCVLSGKVHFCALEAGLTERQSGESPTTVDNAHIVPCSLKSSGEEESREHSDGFWQLLSTFSGIPLEELNGTKIDCPENGVALGHMFHDLFDRLLLCFEATDDPNIYRVLSWTRGDYGLPKTVSFVSRHRIPVPDPRYLALHAACAKVVHQSGMAEILDELLEDLERTDVLSSDGSSASLLHHTLAMAAAHLKATQVSLRIRDSLSTNNHNREWDRTHRLSVPMVLPSCQ
ncbi:hypothetical protein FRC00_010814 [Tulasnella sp. 408]|nr:hypothetical protein FRC00_010814 [Tulasnella sp. 408]